MTIEELKTKSVEEISQIINEYGEKCYKAGEDDACAFEYGRMNDMNGYDSIESFLFDK